MSQTQSLRKKNATDNNSSQSLQRNRTKNDSEALAKKTDSAAMPDTEPLQKKAYRTANDESRVQTKLSVSTPGDSHEQEADRVADEVVSRSAAPAQEENKLNPGSTKPENNAANPQSLQTKISRMAEPAPATTEAPQPETETPASAETATDDEQGVSAEVEQQIAGLRGQGAQLPEQVRTEMESQFNHDFSSVSIHSDSAADALCKQLSARAFTVGSDIFFASGEYAPDSQEGKRLLAHELTHVVQQGSGVTRKIMRDEAVAPAESSGTPADGLVNRTSKTINFESVRIPAFKGDAHRGEIYNRWALKRSKNYTGSRPSDQQAVWQRGIATAQIEEQLRQKADARHMTPVSGQYLFNSPARPITEGGSHVARDQRHFYIGTLREIAQASCSPAWNRRGSATASMEVDHIVEMQISGFPEVERDRVHTIENMELLERRPNSDSGNLIDTDIDQKVTQILENTEKKNILEYSIPGLKDQPRQDRKRDLIRSNYDLIFASYEARGGFRINEQSFWTKSQIEAGEHLAPIEPASFAELGREGHALVFPTTAGGIGKHFVWDGSRTSPANPGEREWFKPFTLIAKRFYTNSDQANLWFGEFDIQIPAEHPRFKPVTKTIYVDRIPGTNLAGRLSQMQVRRSVERLEVKAASPIQMNDVGLEDGSGFVMNGEVIPTIPFLQNANLNFRFAEGDLYVFRTFRADDLNIPSPFSISNSSLTVSINTANGLQVDGAVDFGIEQLGSGSVSGSVNALGEFAVAGQFNFDDRIFGEGTNAQVRIGYADDQWSMGGTITIPEGKVPGIRTATINVDYSQGAGFSATGTASLNVPGVESGTIEITHNEAEGFVIGGSFNLSQGRGIRGGQISARVQEKPDGTGYAVTAHGEAQPDIPGINSNLIVDYNDGAFTAEVSADYARGMLSGRINAGVTNRTVNEDGTLADTAAENNELVVYGGGELTIQIAPWLQGTAGVQFAPNGEITVLGRIEMPDDLEIFARQEINRSIFNIAVQAPIFPGVVAEIGGGLSATAGIGPGVIDQLALQIEYNPAHEEDTHITGDAHLNIPANAGLRLSVRAGIGLGIPLASVTGGLDIGGTLGIEGAAEAGVHVDWTPTTGLDITAELAVHAQPSFTFDIGGYVSVRALGASLYDNRWEFASYTFGSDYRFGIRLPIHYHEGEPFEISTDDIEFEVPDIDTDQLLRGLIARIA